MKAKILIVDDDPVVKMSIEAGLSKSGYETVNVNDGQEALEKIDQIKPDIILSDIIMPRVDGYELHRRLRKNPDTANIPFIFLSVKSEPSDQLKGFRMGADDYLTKPFKLKELISRIERVKETAFKTSRYRSQADFSGNIGQMEMSDVLSIVEMNCKSGELVIRSARGKRIGSVFFKDGKLINALHHPLTGEEAFYELVGKKEVYYDFFGRNININEEITQNNMSALLKAKLLIDEGIRLNKIVPDIDVELSVKSSKIPEKIREIAEDWRLDKILRMVENGRSVRRIIYGGVMSSYRAAAILVDLIEAGILEANKEKFKEGSPANRSERSLIKGLRKLVNQKLTGVITLNVDAVGSAIYLQGGNIIHAYHGIITSKKALFRIFSAKSGNARFQRQPVVVEATINDSLDSLLNEWSAEDEWLNRINEEELESIISVNVEMLDRVSNLKSRSLLMSMISLVQQHGKIRDIINASPLTDLRSYNCLLYLTKLKILSLKKRPGITTQIITDSTADLPPDLVRENKIMVIPLSVTIGKKVYKDGVDIFPNTFYKLLEYSSDFPFTAPATADVFHNIFKKIIPQKDILGIFISKRMSLTYENALAAKSLHYNEYMKKRRKDRGNSGPPQIEILNSEMASLSLGLMVLEAAEKIALGWPIDRVRVYLEGLIPIFRTFVLVDTLEYLKRGGRIGKAKALIGSLFSIKPVLAVKNGEIVPAEQVRGAKRGQKKLEELIHQELSIYESIPPIKAGVMHANAPEKAEQFKSILSTQFQCKQIVVSQIGPTTGTHLGPGTLAVTFFPLLEDQ